MISTLDETIVAVASAPGAGARSIIRLSGTHAVQICANVLIFEDASLLDSKFSVALAAAWSRNDVKVELIAYVWPTSRSYTRQPVVEIHGLLSPVNRDELVLQLTSAGARLAQPGEFTLRAFSAGRMDLLQAEAVLGVIDAESQKSLDTALKQMAGGLSNVVSQLRSDLLNVLADLEAGLDFVDEDIEFITKEQISERLQQVVSHLQEILAQMSVRLTSGELLRVVLQGLPNAGKSQLFNALIATNKAIVSPIAGTTRDYLSSLCRINNIEFELIDTAGIEDSHDDEISKSAQQMTTDQQRKANLAILCCDLSQPIAPWLTKRLEKAKTDEATILVGTKSDLPRMWDWPIDLLATSAMKNIGLDELRQRISEHLISESTTELVASTAARCGDSLRLVIATLDHICELVAQNAGDELIASEIRVALQELGTIAGEVYTNDLLDRIFSRFCIGK